MLRFGIDVILLSLSLPFFIERKHGSDINTYSYKYTLLNFSLKKIHTPEFLPSSNFFSYPFYLDFSYLFISSFNIYADETRKIKRDELMLDLILHLILQVHNIIEKMAGLNVHYPRRSRESDLDYPYPIAGFNSNILLICFFTLS